MQVIFVPQKTLKMGSKTVFRHISAFISRIFLNIRETQSFPRRQQLITFTLYTSSLLLGLTANLCGITGPQSGLTLILNATFAAIIVLLLIIYAYGKLTLPDTFGMMAIVAQLFTCNEMLFCAFSPTNYNLMLITGNMVLLSVNIMFSLLAYLKNTSYLLGAIAMGTYMACAYLTENEALKSFSIVYLLMIIAITALGDILVKDIRRLSQENSKLRQEEEDILRTLKLEKEQVLAYVKLAQQRHDANHTHNILNLLTNKSRDNVIRNVKEMIDEEEMKKSKMSEIFPELTPSEIEICRLVILEKTLYEVCEILGKTEGNITSQRSNIRRKLGLKPTENLKKALQARFNEKKG